MMKLMKRCMLAGMGFITSTSIACACSYPLSSLSDKVKKADQIFIATLEAARVMPGNYPERWPIIEGSFRVSNTLKGPVQPSEVKLVTGIGRGDCGVAMIVSAKYVIFKQRNANGIYTQSGTAAIEDFQVPEAIEKIRSLIEKNTLKQKR